MQKATLVVALMACTVAAPPMLRAQAGGEGTAKLTVTVKDNYGVVPGATVYVVNKATQAAQRQLADSAGVAAFASLPAGSYSVRASLLGFVDFEQPGIVMGAGENKAVDALMTLVQFSTTVTVTTANRREELLLNVANPTTLIDSSQIQDAGARSAKDLLVEQNGSGVQVQPGGGQGYVSINGIPNSGVLVLVNGRRYLGKDANGNFNLEDFQLPGIQRIEVVKGAGSALYGADALGGVINFITTKSEAKGFSSRLDLTGGSYNDYRASDSFSWRGARSGFSAYGGYRTYDGFDLDKKNPQTIGQPESQWYNAGGNAEVEITPKLIGRFFGDYSKRNIDNYFFSGATQLASSVYNSQRELTRYTLSPEIEYLPDANTSIHATYNYGKYLRDETRIFTVGGRMVPQAPWREWNKELKLTGRHSWRAFGADNPLQAGYERRNEKLTRGTLSVSEPNRDINVFWMQQEVSPMSKLKLIGGFRYDDYSDFGHEWSPKFAAVVSPVGNHRIRASYGHGFRAPYFGELFLNQPPFFVGNPDLKPEISDTWTAGYAYAGLKVLASADYSWAKVKNGITFAQLTPSSFTYDNVSQYKAQAVNAALSVSLPAGLTPSVSYTHIKRKNDSGQDIGGYPTDALFLKLLWSNPRLGLRANFRGQINGDQPPSIADGSRAPAYNVWYVQASKRLLARGAYAWNVFAQVDNLFDERDVFRRNESGNPIPGEFQVWLAPRTFLAGIAVDMDWTK